jgi:hypothetical protein
MLAADSVKSFTAPLRQNDGLGSANSSQVLIIWQPACAQDILVRDNVRMEG